jgi:molybdopterin/thiamine biosynthesis adenylyltransferase
MSTSFAFSYEEMVSRNAALLSATEQALLREARVLVCGAGGVGGAALQSLVRAGVGAVTIADRDVFERSNLNRQLFATADTVGKLKAPTTADSLLRINPSLAVETRGADWVEQLDEILPAHQVVIDAMDDVAAGIALYRKAREHGVTVVGSYAVPMPSVTVVRPADPRPEERLGYPTTRTNWRVLTDDEVAGCRQAEVRYALVHSSWNRHVDPELIAGLLSGTQSTPSLAPLTIVTGTLMALETIKLLAQRDTVDCRGVFLDPWTLRIERPRPAPVAWAREWMTARKLRQIANRDRQGQPH